MISKQLQQYINQFDRDEQIALFPIEQEYAKQQNVMDADSNVIDKRWTFTLIERCVKETEELKKEETAAFMEQPISFLSNNMDEFLYVESDHFDMIGVDGIALEVDDLFGTYTALFGLKLQKKWEAVIKSYLDEKLGEKTYSALFSPQDGLWEINIPLDRLPTFNPEVSLQTAIDVTYQTVFELETVIEAMN